MRFGGLMAGVIPAGYFLATFDFSLTLRSIAFILSGLFFAALPTTAGTGAEITANSVLTDPETKIKKSIKLQFVPLQKIIDIKLKNEAFKKSFTEEMGRLKLAHDIRVLREKKKMTQADVAQMTDMPQSVIARIESGTHGFSVATLHKIARVFDRRITLTK